MDGCLLAGCAVKAQWVLEGEVVGGFGGGRAL